MCFLPNTYFHLPRNPLQGILGRNYYPSFTDEEIEGQGALVIFQNCIVKKKKEMEVSHSFSGSQVQALSALPLLWEGLEEQLILVEEAWRKPQLINKEFTLKSKMCLVGRWAYLEIEKFVKPEKARSTYYAKDVKGLGARELLLFYFSVFFFTCQNFQNKVPYFHIQKRWSKI